MTNIDGNSYTQLQFDPRMDLALSDFISKLWTAVGSGPATAQSISDATNFIMANGGDTPAGRFALYASWIQQGFCTTATKPTAFGKILGIIPHQWLIVAIAAGIAFAILLAYCIWRFMPAKGRSRFGRGNPSY